MDFKRILFVAAILSSFLSCNKDKDKDDFDRKAMLNNMASAIIQPSLQELSNDLTDLHASAQTFVTSVNQSNLEDLRLKYILAYKSFQHCKMFDFGPLMDEAIKASMNTYPTDISQIESNINSGSYDLNAVSNIDAIGFPAIDFLLYPNFSSVTAAVDSFSISSTSGNRCVYLTNLTAKMKNELASVVSGWSTYQTTFINADGNDVGSSTSLLFNEFVKDIDLLKNAKIGIPSGQQTGGQTLPTYVEGYYAQISTDLALENVTALKNVFLGALGSGFDDYIKDVEGDEVTTSLADNISSQFDVVTTTLNAIGTPLSDKVDTDPTTVNNAFQEIKKLLTYCKTDMSSTIGLLITFQDNDGD